MVCSYEHEWLLASSHCFAVLLFYCSSDFISPIFVFDDRVNIVVNVQILKAHPHTGVCYTWDAHPYVSTHFSHHAFTMRVPNIHFGCRTLQVSTASEVTLSNQDLIESSFLAPKNWPWMSGASTQPTCIISFIICTIKVHCGCAHEWWTPIWKHGRTCLWMGLRKRVKILHLR